MCGSIFEPKYFAFVRLVDYRNAVSILSCAALDIQGQDAFTNGYIFHVFETIFC